MQKTTYKTTCLETASAIMTAGGELLRLEKTADRKSVFVFKQNQRLSEILQLITQQRLNLPSHLLLGNLKFLKTRVKDDNPYRS